MTDIVERLRNRGTPLNERAALVIEGLRMECEELQERINKLAPQRKTGIPILGTVDQNGTVHWKGDPP